MDVLQLEALGARTATELSSEFDFDSLTEQLQAVIDSKDPLGYIKNNVNWEIDKDVDADNGIHLNSPMMKASNFSANVSYEFWNPFRRFLNWLNNSRVAKKIKKALCFIADKIKELIDEGATLKKILTVAIGAIAAAVNISLNPATLTIIVGFLATMILDGVTNFCAV